MTCSQSDLLLSLRQLQQERRTLLGRLTRPGELAIGSVSQVRRKCGNPACHCAREGGHLQTLFVFTDRKQGRRRCKLVRRADESRMRKAGERYRAFRKGLQRLRAIDSEEKRILMAIAEERAVHYK